MGTSIYTIGHLSDTHLGYEAYPALSASGNNQRGEDMVRAFRNVVDDIRGFDPDLVIHAGDVTERPKVDIRYMLVAQRYFTKLAELRPDGSRRQVIIVAGNHEQPRSHKEACWLELLSSIPGIHVVTEGYRIVRFGADPSHPAALSGVAVHCLPHDMLKEIDFAEVVPDPSAASNVLVAHGVAMGSELFTRAIGREYSIDADMMARNWDYVALGHFHKRGPVAGNKRGGVDRIWYSGSSENVSFRDLRENGSGKGYLRVKVDHEQLVVTPVDLPIRTMMRLPVVDASNKSAEDLTSALVANIESSDVTGAVVGQIVENVSRDMWSLLDIASVRQRAKGALHYEITARYGQPDKKKDDGEPKSSLGDLAVILEEEIATSASAPLADKVRELATSLLGSALAGELEPAAGDATEGIEAAETAVKEDAK